MGKIRWQREEGGTAVPYILEEGELRWKRYNSSHLHVPDTRFSKGYATFLKALELGYEVVDLKQ